MYGNLFLSNSDSEQGQTEYDGIVAGGVRYLGVFLNYMTLSEDAIGSFLTLDLPASILDAPQRITSVIGITNTPTVCNIYMYMHVHVQQNTCSV